MSEKSAGGGLGLVAVATIVLVTLKFTETMPVASWSWMKVLLGPLACAVVFWVVALLLIGGSLGAAISGTIAGAWWGQRRMRKLNQLADEEEERERENT